MRQVRPVAQVGLLVESSLVLREGRVGHLQREMRDREGEIEEERLVAVLLEEAQGVVRHHVERVLAPLILPVLRGVGRIVAVEPLVRAEVLVGELDALSVPPQVGRVEVVRELLVQIPEEVVEALVAGLPQRATAAQAPLPDRARCVARLPQQRADRERARVEGHLTQLLRVGIAADLEVVADLAVARMKPRHERGP